jgi:hypothetical protein
MKKIIKNILAIALISYLLASFYYLDLNPMNWEKEMRGAVGLFVAFCSMLIYVLPKFDV